MKNTNSGCWRCKHRCSTWGLIDPVPDNYQKVDAREMYVHCEVDADRCLEWWNANGEKTMDQLEPMSCFTPKFEEISPLDKILESLDDLIEILSK